MIKICKFFSCALCFYYDFPVSDKMNSTSHQCPGDMLYSNCHGKSCSAGDYCFDCHDCSDRKWKKVNVYEKSAIQWEKQERKVKSSSSFSSFSHPYLRWTLAHLIMQCP